MTCLPMSCSGWHRGSSASWLTPRAGTRASWRAPLPPAAAVTVSRAQRGVGIALPPPHPHPFLRSLCLSAAIQSVLCGADALQPTKTGAVGSAKLALHENGTLEYQVMGTGTAPGTALHPTGHSIAAHPRLACRCGWWARPAKWWGSHWRPNRGGRTGGTSSST